MQKRTIEISLSELFENYNNDKPESNPDLEIRAYNKKLIVKPEYQREYKCEDKTTLKEDLMDSIIHDLELPKFIWVAKEGEFELLDGQQRTRMICDFMNNLYAIKYDGKNKFFDRLPNEIQNKIKRYIIDITILSDISKEDIIKQFKRINKNQTMIKRQEELNAAHTGKWLSLIKEIFSKKKR